MATFSHHFIILIQLVTIQTWDIPAHAVCEYSELTLTCPHNRRINITYANYGRRIPSSVFCPYPGPSTLHVDRTDCISNNTKPIIQSKCDGQQTCTVLALNSIFGIPCANTFKYLEVEYDCILDDTADSLTKALLTAGFSTDATPRMSSAMPTEQTTKPTSSSSERGNDITTWILICVIVFLSTVVCTVIVIHCLKRKRSDQGISQTDLSTSNSSCVVQSVCENDAYSHTYEQLQKCNTLYENCP